MWQELLKDTRQRMQQAKSALERELSSIRAGRATPALLEKIRVDYYGVPTPLQQMATIQVPEPRLLVIHPWDKSQIPAIEKAIQKSDLGLSPVTEGGVIRLAIPPLTQERRQELVKSVRHLAEQARVAVRNIRRDANDKVRELIKEGSVSEDEGKRAQDEIQKLVDSTIAEIDRLLEEKEKEILEV
ncbi:MAG: ribosome recycling factor [Clostridiales bacterium]|nr:ribosome recycling factor [Clostridiales bacterium]